jgi:hypothetical protein
MVEWFQNKLATLDNIYESSVLGEIERTRMHQGRAQSQHSMSHPTEMFAKDIVLSHLEERIEELRFLYTTAKEVQKCSESSFHQAYKNILELREEINSQREGLHEHLQQLEKQPNQKPNNKYVFNKGVDFMTNRPVYQTFIPK